MYQFKRMLFVSLAIATLSSGTYGQQVMSLEDIYRMADENSQSMKVYQTAQESASASVKEAKSAFLPDINLSLSGSYIGNATLMDRKFSTHGTTEIHYAIAPYVGQATLGKQDTPHWGNNFAFEASQVLYAGGAISAGVRMAKLGEQMAALDYQKNQQDIRFLLTGYYLDLCKLLNLQEVVSRNIELTQKVLDNMNARFEQGTVLKNDITRYELQLENLQLQLTQLKDAASIINHQLASTLHLPEGSVILPDTMQLKTEGQRLYAGSSVEQHWQEQATQSNIGLHQAQLAANIADQQLKASKAQNVPHIALIAEDHLGGPYTNDLIPVDANTNAWFIGVGIRYNLSSLYKNNHSVRKAKIEVQKANESVALAQEGVENGVQASHVNYMTAFSEVRTQEKSVELAKENYSVICNRYENDLALLTDMLDASNILLSADMGLVNAQINLIYNYYKLKYITHTL
ncbi:MAG: TolC family protein [Bacteroidales bacterium]|nr:TolC family protein [Bacteroidales bacterium]